MATVRLSRRRLVETLGIAAVGSVLAACTPPPAPTPTPQQKPSTQPTTSDKPTAAAQPTAAPANKPAASAASGQVLWWALAEFDIDSYQKELLDTYQKHSPKVDLKMELLPEDSWQEKLTPSLVAGTGPDIFVLFTVPISNWTQVTMDLNQYAKGPDGINLADFDGEAMQQEGIIDGHLVGLPRSKHGGQGWFYNKELFDNAGVPYPKIGWTWKDVEEIAPKLTEKSKRMYGLSLQSTLNPADFGFLPISDDRKTVIDHFDSPKAIEAFELYKRLYDGYAPTMDQLMTEFQDAMGGGAGPLGGFLSKRVAFNFLGVATHPLVTKGGITWGYVNAPWPIDPADRHKPPKGYVLWSINKNTKNPDGSWNFLKWLTGREGAKIMAKAGYFVAFRDALEAVNYPKELLDVMFYPYGSEWKPAYPNIWSIECFPTREWSSMSEKVLGSPAAQLDQILHEGAKQGQAALDACWAKK